MTSALWLIQRHSSPLKQIVDQLGDYNTQLAKLNTGSGSSASDLRDMAVAVEGMQAAMSKRFATMEVSCSPLQRYHRACTPWLSSIFCAIFEREGILPVNGMPGGTVQVACRSREVLRIDEAEQTASQHGCGTGFSRFLLRLCPNASHSWSICHRELWGSKIRSWMRLSGEFTRQRQSWTSSSPETQSAPSLCCSYLR